MGEIEKAMTLQDHHFEVLALLESERGVKRSQDLAA